MESLEKVQKSFEILSSDYQQKDSDLNEVEKDYKKKCNEAEALQRYWPSSVLSTKFVNDK